MAVRRQQGRDIRFSGASLLQPRRRNWTRRPRGDDCSAPDHIVSGICLREAKIHGGLQVRGAKNELRLVRECLQLGSLKEGLVDTSADIALASEYGRILTHNGPIAALWS